MTIQKGMGSVSVSLLSLKISLRLTFLLKSDSYFTTASLTHCVGCPRAGWRVLRPPAERPRAPAGAAETSSSEPSHSPHDKRTRHHTLALHRATPPFAQHCQCHQRAYARTRLIGIVQCQLGPVSVRADRRAKTEYRDRRAPHPAPPPPARRARTDAARESYAQ